MRRTPLSRSAFFNLRALIGFGLCFLGVVLALFALDLPTKGQGASSRTPQEMTAVRGARSFHGDVRTLPYIRPVKKERPEREPPPLMPRFYQPPGGTSATPSVSAGSITSTPAMSAPAPGPSLTFDGLDFANWGGGHPPDENGDVGPTYYIQVVNTSIGIFDKTTGNRVAAFTFNTFMSQGQFGNLCDTDNFGDPV